MSQKIRRRRGLIRKGAALTGGVSALFAGVGLLWLATALPRLDGRIAARGVAAPVEILRDPNAVPHIIGRSAEDVYFGLGFAQAQDRLWQMEFNRRLAAGRLAEILGPEAVKTDRLFRTLGLWRHSAASVAALDPETRAALEAYARGVNAYIDRHRGPWPPEFMLLGTRPAHWRPADSVAIIEVMSVLLCGNMFQELERAALAPRLSPAQLRQFDQPNADDGTAIIGALGDLYRRFGLRGGARALPPGGASNDWVVAGSRSVTGKPLLANDTHLPLTAPSVFYLAHLGLPSGNAVGATLPGVPGIIVGRTDRIAWGFTTTAADVQDLYVEQTDPADPGRYRTPGGWARFGTRREIIKVRGAADETLIVRTSRHGPILPPEMAEGDEPLALRWTLYDRPDTTLAAAIRMPKARNWSEFVVAFKSYVAPMQNVVYADRDGHIGFIAAALVPVRRTDNALMGRAPAPGWEARYDWTGFVRFKALPNVADPGSGMLYSANNKIVGPDYPYFLTGDWDTPDRAERIKALLAATPKHSLDTFARMQQDVLSPLADDFLPALLAAKPRTASGRAAQTLMRGWDGRMVADAPQPLIFIAWLRTLDRLIEADELGPAFEQSWRIRPQFLRDVLTPESAAAAWCDDVTTPGREDCAGRAALALDQSAAALARRFGPNASAWRWGRAHVARNVHRPFDAIPGLRAIFDVTVESPGGPFTLDRGLTEFASDDPYVNRHAAAYRGIYDLAEPDRSRFMLPTGQSGNPLSADYRRLAQGWAKGRTITIVTGEAALKRAARHRLVIVPAG